MAGDPALLCIAKSFSRPVCNGYTPDLAVAYPVVLLEEWQGMREGGGYIVLDDIHSRSERLAAYRRSWPILCTERGFGYGKVFYEGPYCVLQRIDHPLQPEQSVVWICSNDWAAFRNNLFLRRVILPSNLEDLHLYWNNEALVMTPERFHGVYEWGAPLREIR